VLPYLAGGVLAMVLAGAAVWVFWLGPAGPTRPDRTAATAGSPSADRPQDRAGRGEDRSPTVESAPTTPAPTTAAPTAAPTTEAAKPSKSTAKPTKTPTQPAGGGAVTASGTCQASFYTDEGNLTANGEVFHVKDFTAAHKSLPFNTRVRVTNTANSKSVVVRINDRGPFIAGRCLDLTPAAFDVIASRSAGVASVRFEVLAA
jgi:rare lipoprotein A